MPEISTPVAVYWLCCVGAFLAIGQIRWVFAYYLLAIPGTFLHEICHWLSAKVLRGRPGKFSLMLRKVGNRYALGEVTFVPGQFNTVFIALSPLLLILIWALLLPSLVDNVPKAAVLGLLGGIVARSGFPSSQDWKVAFSRPLGFIPLGALVFLFYLSVSPF